jgi:hydrogenase maturation protease
VLLIGYGNILRGDDALGPMAIERLRTRLTDAEFVSCHQLGPELAERLAECDLAVFVDAADGREPGSVEVKRPSPEAVAGASLTHHVKPEALLALAQTLYGRAPQAMLVTGAGSAFDGEGLSEKGYEALIEICRLVPLLVRDFLT